MWIERNAIIPARLDYSFHPSRMMKVLGMAMNMRISNYFDYFDNWRPCLFNSEWYEDFSNKDFRSEQDLIDTNNAYANYVEKVWKKQYLGIYLFMLPDYLEVRPDKEMYTSCFSDGFIADQRTARDRWPKDLPRFDYKPTHWKQGIATAVDNELAQLLMIVPKEVHELHEQEEAEQKKHPY